MAMNGRSQKMGHSATQKDGEGIIFVMVGLPARRKSYISNKLLHYLKWKGYRSELFNVGKYRREVATSKHSHDFFSNDNTDSQAQREKLAHAVLDQVFKFLGEGGDCAIFDATNTTNSRRVAILKRCEENPHAKQTIFIESICDDEKVLEANLLQKIRNSPDYKDMDVDEALADLTLRIKHYERVYEPVENDDLSYIKLVNLQSKVICNQIHGMLPHTTVAFLMSIHIEPRPIYLVRAGHVDPVKNLDDFRPDLSESAQDPRQSSLYKIPSAKDLEGSQSISLQERTIGLSLSERGKDYARKLVEFIRRDTENKHIEIFSSTVRRSVETASVFGQEVHQFSAFNMLDTGIVHGMTPKQIQKSLPEEWKKFQADPLHYRIPGGECFADLVNRLSPYIIELERIRDPIVVVAHLPTLQVLYSYFMQKDVKECYAYPIEQGTIIKLAHTQYGFKEKIIRVSDSGKSKAAHSVEATSL